MTAQAEIDVTITPDTKLGLAVTIGGVSRVDLTTADTRAYRLASLDMIRGLAIVIMAIDHVRDYFLIGGELDPTANQDIGAALFFTRWITHSARRSSCSSPGRAPA